MFEIYRSVCTVDGWMDARSGVPPTGQRCADWFKWQLLIAYQCKCKCVQVIPLCVSPAIDRRPVPGVPHSVPGQLELALVFLQP